MGSLNSTFLSSLSSIREHNLETSYEGHLFPFHYELILHFLSCTLILLRLWMDQRPLFIRLNLIVVIVRIANYSCYKFLKILVGFITVYLWDRGFNLFPLRVICFIVNIWAKV